MKCMNGEEPIRECIVLKDEMVEVIIINKGNCSFRDAMQMAIDKIRSEM